MSAGPEREKQWRQGWEGEFCRAWFPALTNYNMQWVSEWSPICPFPAFPLFRPPSHPVFFHHPKSRTQGLEEGPICIDTGCWPRKPRSLAPESVTRVEHLPFLLRLATSEEPSGQGTYMTYAPIKLPTNFQNSPTGIKHLQPAEGSVRKFRLPQCSIVCSIYPTCYMSDISMSKWTNMDKA